MKLRMNLHKLYYSGHILYTNIWSIVKIFKLF